MKKLKQFGLFMLVIWPQLLLAEAIDVTLHYVGPTDGQVWAGLQQGLTEANHQGQFLGQNYVIEVVSADDLAQMSTDSVTAVLLATDAEHIFSIAQMDKFSQVPVFNLTSDSDDLRQACLSNLLNIPVSQQMKSDALGQWQNKNPDQPVTAQGWHEDFKKFAAAQLNIRFTRNHQTKMDDAAWAGWAAVKMLSDTVARSQQTQAAAILDYLKNDLSFDGQKGDTATFRDTGQLRQIVLLIDENNKIAAEAPLRGTKGGLESLGLTSCK